MTEYLPIGILATMINTISATELALFLGKTIGWASNLRTGRKKLPVAECFRVSKHFGIPLYELRKDFPREEIRPDIFGK